MNASPRMIMPVPSMRNGWPQQYDMHKATPEGADKAPRMMSNVEARMQNTFPFQDSQGTQNTGTTAATSRCEIADFSFARKPMGSDRLTITDNPHYYC